VSTISRSFCSFDLRASSARFRSLRRDQLDECRLRCLAPEDGNSIQSLLQSRIVEAQWVRDGIYAVLSGQLDRSLPQ
jgi:hypothetical protein